MIERLRYVLKMIRWRDFSMAYGRCPLCGPGLFVRLFDGDFGVRCIRCGAAQNTVALVATIKELVPGLGRESVHLVSIGGPYFDWLRKHSGHLSYSQYFDQVPAGQMVDGVRCEDLQRLTYADASFGLVTSSEVLEHVADDRAAFAEIVRVLRPGGYLIFTVPLQPGRKTTCERARLRPDGDLEHLLPPEYHSDPIRGNILAFRNYGTDILERLRASGFDRAEIRVGRDPSGFAAARPVIIAAKAARAESAQRSAR